MVTMYMSVVVSTIALILTYITGPQKSTPKFSIAVDFIVLAFTAYTALGHLSAIEYLPAICFGVSALNWLICLVIDVKYQKAINQKNRAEKLKKVKEMLENMDPSLLSPEDHTEEEDEEEKSTDQSDENLTE